MQRFLVEIGRGLDLGLLLTSGVNEVCPEEMVEWSGLAESPVAELTATDCIFPSYTLFWNWDHHAALRQSPDQRFFQHILCNVQ